MKHNSGPPMTAVVAGERNVDARRREAIEPGGDQGGGSVKMRCAARLPDRQPPLRMRLELRHAHRVAAEEFPPAYESFGADVRASHPETEQVSTMDDAAVVVGEPGSDPCTLLAAGAPGIGHVLIAPRVGGGPPD